MVVLLLWHLYCHWLPLLENWWFYYCDFSIGFGCHCQRTDGFIIVTSLFSLAAIARELMVKVLWYLYCLWLPLPENWWFDYTVWIRHFFAATCVSFCNKTEKNYIQLYPQINSVFIHQYAYLYIFVQHLYIILLLTMPNVC
jgi:hypothetical protein